jgi:putative addiction module component (TIGR02574 family)
MGDVTRRLEEAFARARELPAEEQDALAEAVFEHIEWARGDTHLTPEQVDEVKRRLAEMGRGAGSYATDEEMEALWKKCAL